MSKANTQWWQRLWSGRRLLHRQQRGQSLVIVTFAFIGILAFVGLAIDLGWVYVERVRVAQAADAAALAGASELPLEGAAHTRALVYLQENGYDYTDEGDVALFINDEEHAPAEDKHTNIWVDTDYSRDESLPPAQQLNTADRIQVRVRQDVFMTFMQFIGFRYVSVEATAEAENISNIDTAIVYDKSGSMEFDTLCYGCWEPSEEPYPNGHIYPLHWSDTTIEAADHCTPTNRYYERGGEIYVVIEAEEYSRLNESLDPEGIAPYYTFWVLQRNDYNEYWNEQVGAKGRDERGAYLSHHPFANYQTLSGLGAACTWQDLTNGEYCRRDLPAGGPFPAPRADYDFYAPRDGSYYFHIRGQGGNYGGDRHVFWGVDGDVKGQEGGFSRGPLYDGAAESAWDWHRLSKGEGGNLGDTVSLDAGDHTLHLWAGGAGFDVDRMIISTDGSLDSTERNLSPNDGRTDWACQPCDPRFGGRPGGAYVCDEGAPPSCTYRPDCSGGGNPDQRENAIYDDEQPIRNALEAAKHFVSRLNPRFDQVGYVRYSTNAEIASELECLRHLGADNCTTQVITDTVLYKLDRTQAGGSTNIAGGVKLGIDVLSTVAPHYGRPGAAHVMVLMTDGQANLYPNYPNYHECWQEDLWPDVGDRDIDRAADCVVHYAQKARDNAIVVYTISLGESADRELMTEVAELTGGFQRGADSREELDKIFNELYERIFLRLIH
jgi:hypothetical protein